MSQYQVIPVTLFQQNLTLFGCGETNQSRVIYLGIILQKIMQVYLLKVKGVSLLRALNKGDEMPFISESRPMGIFGKVQVFFEGLR